LAKVLNKRQLVILLWLH